MVKENYACAYKEVIELLKYFSLKDIQRIPEDLITVFLENMDNEYEYTVEEGKPFEEQEMLDETKVIFAIIFRDYWATDYQRERILAKEKNDRRKMEEEKAKKYNPENLFKERNIEREEKPEKPEKIVALVKVKEETLLSKIIKKIKSIFSKNK